jgi:hypothetical protein
MSFIIVKKDEKMKLTLLTTAALLGIAVSPALAGNLDEPFVPQSPIPMAPPPLWSIRAATGQVFMRVGR